MWPKSGEEGTRIARIRQIRTDQVIRENLYDPRHPCSIKSSDLKLAPPLPWWRYGVVVIQFLVFL